MPANCDDELSEFDASASDTSVLLSANRSVNRPITLNAAASGVLPSFDIIFHALSDGSIFVGVSSLSSVKLCTEPASSSDDSSSADPDRFGRELVEKTDSSSDSSDSTYVACAYRSLWVISLWVILFSFFFCSLGIHCKTLYVNRRDLVGP